MKLRSRDAVHDDLKTYDGIISGTPLKTRGENVRAADGMLTLDVRITQRDSSHEAHAFAMSSTLLHMHGFLYPETIIQPCSVGGGSTVLGSGVESCQPAGLRKSNM